MRPRASRRRCSSCRIPGAPNTQTVLVPSRSSATGSPVPLILPMIPKWALEPPTRQANVFVRKSLSRPRQCWSHVRRRIKVGDPGSSAGTAGWQDETRLNDSAGAAASSCGRLPDDLSTAPSNPGRQRGSGAVEHLVDLGSPDPRTTTSSIRSGICDSPERSKMSACFSKESRNSLPSSPDATRRARRAGHHRDSRIGALVPRSE